ncbi:glycoside hydrolase family 2 protein [Sphingobacterium bambusae]|uniref:Glycoside hydrolase family 2 TIM barrel-domain containing protein n=1 Tax=Sphingobacterium bambusae TaxID=662858 RepID=A0ABW6BJH4_9SPHI|nr:glycoside hydrolase family 2 TIM barrel-domain containing protein [Sphingobacterium bambusae]WPL49482.1 glycoside hydrolase family 2 TIM barrel-domain containing protein [Sphingobacterium bambusae]
MLKLIRIPLVRSFSTVLLLMLIHTASLLAQEFSTINGKKRIKLNFNREWKFQLGDHIQALDFAFQDEDWDAVGLPHSFSMPYFMSPEFYVGYGWYRKTFDLPELYDNKKKFLEFEGVFQEAEIYLNGVLVGKHQGGYTGFNVDISSAAKRGKNILAVRVNNIWNPGLAPRAGEHVFSGGIYRDVYLVLTNSVHVDWNGTFILTPKVSSKSATVRIQTEVKNDQDKIAEVQTITQIKSPSGKIVKKISTTRQLKPREIALFDQTAANLSNPHLWTLENPHRYTAVTTLVVNGKVEDVYESKFGIRSIRWTSDKGFFLNDKHIYLLGANVHQDQAGWGDAVTNMGFVRDVQMMKDAGFNFIRGSHYPHDPAFVEACDSIGMFFWSESTFWGIGGSDNVPEGYWNTSAYPTVEKDRQSFENSNRQTLTDMIRIHRNSPSIIAWSMSNEPFFTAANTIEPTRNLLKDLVALSRKLDPSRPAAVGGAQRPLDANRIDIIGDIAGYNGDGGVIDIFQNPGIPSIVSEYGSTTADRPGDYEPGWGDLSKVEGKPIYPWRAGQAIWCGFDHGSIAGSRLGKMGIVDYFRIPKRAWYWYRHANKGIDPPEWPIHGVAAKLKIEASKLVVSSDGTEDIQLIVSVRDGDDNALNNCPPVKLEIVTGPARFPTGKNIIFEKDSDIRILDGQAAISARAYFSGESIIRATSPGLSPAEVKLTFLGENPYVDGISQITKDNSYKRFVRDRQETILQKFGVHNPTFASSANPSHLTGYAADNNEKTYWQSQEDDINPWWSVDTEKKLKIHSINLVFPEKDKYHFVVEVSNDNKTWVEIADFLTGEDFFDRKRIIVAGQVAALVRVRFTNFKKAKISEVEIVGEVVN